MAAQADRDIGALNLWIGTPWSGFPASLQISRRLVHGLGPELVSLERQIFINDGARAWLSFDLGLGLIGRWSLRAMTAAKPRLGCLTRLIQVDLAGCHPTSLGGCLHADSILHDPDGLAAGP